MLQFVLAVDSFDSHLDELQKEESSSEKCLEYLFTLLEQICLLKEGSKDLIYTNSKRINSIELLILKCTSFFFKNFDILISAVPTILIQHLFYKFFSMLQIDLADYVDSNSNSYKQENWHNTAFVMFYCCLIVESLIRNYSQKNIDIFSVLPCNRYSLFQMIMTLELDKDEFDDKKAELQQFCILALENMIKKGIKMQPLNHHNFQLNSIQVDQVDKSQCFESIKYISYTMAVFSFNTLNHGMCMDFLGFIDQKLELRKFFSVDSFKIACKFFLPHSKSRYKTVYSSNQLVKKFIQKNYILDENFLIEFIEQINSEKISYKSVERIVELGLENSDDDAIFCLRSLFLVFKLKNKISLDHKDAKVTNGINKDKSDFLFSLLKKCFFDVKSLSRAIYILCMMSGSNSSFTKISLKNKFINDFEIGSETSQVLTFMDSKLYFDDVEEKLLCNFDPNDCLKIVDSSQKILTLQNLKNLSININPYSDLKDIFIPLPVNNATVKTFILCQKYLFCLAQEQFEIAESFKSIIDFKHTDLKCIEEPLKLHLSLASSTSKNSNLKASSTRLASDAKYFIQMAVKGGFILNQALELS
ncbi:MAG: hypothetical protein MHPSP_002209, partial [Paramarteilia canceri]